MGSFAGSKATLGTNLRHAMIAREPKFFGNQIGAFAVVSPLHFEQRK
jgi:hypothetical protein